MAAGTAELARNVRYAPRVTAVAHVYLGGTQVGAATFGLGNIESVLRVSAE